GIGDACDPTPNCPTNPAACSSPGKSILQIKDQAPPGTSAGDQISWKWLKGTAVQSDFANPTSTATYTLCLYTGGPTPTVETEIDIPASATLWKVAGTKGYKYKDPSSLNDGVQKLIVKGGGTGKSKIILKGKDGYLPMPALPLDVSGGSVVVQLH